MLKACIKPPTRIKFFFSSCSPFCLFAIVINKNKRAYMQSIGAVCPKASPAFSQKCAYYAAYFLIKLHYGFLTSIKTVNLRHIFVLVHRLIFLRHTFSCRPCFIGRRPQIRGTAHKANRINSFNCFKTYLILTSHPKFLQLLARSLQGRRHHLG